MNVRQSQAGFTLVELVICFSISLVILGMVAETGKASDQFSDTTLALGRLEEKASQTSFEMAKELRWAQPTTVLITLENDASRIDFFKADGFVAGLTTWTSAITYSYQPSPIDSNGNGIADEGILVRTQDGKERVLCRNVDAGSLAIDRAEDSIQIQLTHFQVTGDKRVLNGTIQIAASLINR
jgi:type II secretory pathway pseudopilin PulG